MFAKNRRLTLENLEVRQMMAGDVAASLQNGSLFLTEAAGQAGMDNAVLISQLPNGMIRVAGNATTTDNTVSKVNGAAYQDFSVSGSLNISFGGGSDLIVIGSELGQANPTFSEVHIDTAAPPLVFQPRVLGGATSALPVDNDDVIIWGLNTHGAMTVNTGAGNDWVYVSGLTMTAGDLTINSGAGADTVEITNIPVSLAGNIFVQTYSSLAENDADVVWFDYAYSQGNMQVLMGGGNDLFHMSNSSTLKSLYLDAGAGDDTVNIDHVVVVDDLMAHLGDGNDNMTIDYLWGNDFHFLGEGGTDSLNKTANVYGHSLEQTGWEYVNGRMQTVGQISGGLLTTKMA